MNISVFVCRRTVLILSVIVAALAASVYAIVNLETATFTVKGETINAKSSSGIAAGSGSSTLPNLFDGDSATCWFEGYANERTGRWIDIKYPAKKRFKGMILGLGCRKAQLCLEEFSVPLSINLKLNEKPAMDYSVDWDMSSGLISHETVNMRKTIIWFNSDTAYTSANVTLKFTNGISGARYANLAVSDFELIDAFDSRFELLSMLTTNHNFNPNDCGTINSPVLFVGDDEPRWISHAVDSLFKSGVVLDNGEQMETALNASMHTISDSKEIVRLIGVLKKQLITDNRMPRFIQDGRTITYMLYIGTINSPGKHWNIWRSVATKKTSKGLELTVRYVPFVN